jgi:hypothetical protein
MSNPDPCFDPENSYKDDEMNSHFDDYQYDYHDDFYGEDDSYDDSMDGDHDSAMTSCGWGTDEDYGYFGENDDDSFYGEDY